MNLYFNDLTVCRDTDADLARLRNFVSLFRRFQLQTGESHIWIPKSIKDYLRTLRWTNANLTLWQWVNSTFNLKSDESPIEREEVENRFMESEFEIETDKGVARCDQMGIAALTKPQGGAYSLTLGLDDGDFWSKLYYVVVERMVTKATCEYHNALCLTREDDVSNRDVANWCQSAYVVALPTCTIDPAEKRINLRDDHGVDVLMPFARRVVRSPYVIEVVNSLPFQPAATRFVEHIDVATGIIRLRLLRDDRGLGVAIKTTGETRDQLERIAKLLSDKYGR